MPSQNLEAKVTMDVSDVPRAMGRMMRDVSDTLSNATKSFDKFGNSINTLVKTLDKTNQQFLSTSQSLDMMVDKLGRMGGSMSNVSTASKRMSDDLSQGQQKAATNIDKTTTSLEKQGKVVDMVARRAAQVAATPPPPIAQLTPVVGPPRAMDITRGSQGGSMNLNAANMQQMVETSSRTIDTTTKRAQAMVAQMQKEGVEGTFKGMSDFLDKQGVLTNSKNQQLVTQVTSMYSAMYKKQQADSKIAADAQIRDQQRVANASLQTVSVMSRAPLAQRAQTLVEQGQKSGATTLAEFQSFLNKPVGSQIEGNTGLTPEKIAALEIWKTKLGQVDAATKIVTADVTKMGVDATKASADAATATLNQEQKYEMLRSVVAELNQEISKNAPVISSQKKIQDEVAKTASFLEQEAKASKGVMSESAASIGAAAKQYAIMGPAGVESFASIRTAADAHAKTMQKIAKPPKFGGFFNELRQELTMTTSFALRQVPIVGRVLASGFRAAEQTAAANARRAAMADPGDIAGGAEVGASALTKFGGIATTTALILGAVTVAAVAAGAALGKHLADSVAQSNDQLENMGKVVNISATSLSGLEGVATMQGESLDGLTRSLTTLNDKMQEAAQGNRVVDAQLKALGIEAVDPLTGKVNATLPAILKMSDTMKDMGDTSERTNATMGLFGGMQAAKMIKMFGDGSAKVIEFMDANRAAGNVLTEEQRMISHEYLDTIRKFGMAWDGLKTQIGVALMPVLTGLFESLTSLFGMIKDFVHSDIIQEFGDIFKIAAATWAGDVKTALQISAQYGKTGVDRAMAELDAVGQQIKDKQAELDKLLNPSKSMLPSSMEDFVKPFLPKQLTDLDPSHRIGKLTSEIEGLNKRQQELQLATKGVASSFTLTAVPADKLFSSFNSLSEATNSWTANEKKSDIAADPAKFIAMSDAIFDATQSMNQQIVSIKAQELALGQGTIAAKYFEEQQKHNDDMAKARRENRFGQYTEQGIAGLDAVFNQQQKQARALDENLAKLKGTDFATEIEEKNRSLVNSFRKLNDSIADTVTYIEPGKKAFIDFTRSIADMQVQVEDLLKTARLNAGLNAKFPGLFPDAAGQVQDLERQLLKLRLMAADPVQMRMTFDTKAINSMLDARKNEIDSLRLDLRGVEALSSEEKVRLEVERDILQLKKDGVERDSAALQAKKEEFIVQERIKNSIQEQISLKQDQRAGRENIEDRMNQFRLDTAVTAEERAQVQLQMKITEERRKGIDLLDGQHNADLQIYTDQARLSAQLDDMIKQYQQIAGEIEGSMHNALSAFGDAYGDILKKLAGDSSKTWKDIARDFFTTMRDAALDISKTLGKALIDQALKGLTGNTTDEWIKQIAGGVAKDAVPGAGKGQTPEVMMKSATDILSTQAQEAKKFLVEAAFELKDAAAVLKGTPSAVAQQQQQQPTTGPAPAFSSGFPTAAELESFVLTVRDDERRRIMIESIGKQPTVDQSAYSIDAKVGKSSTEGDMNIYDAGNNMPAGVSNFVDQQPPTRLPGGINEIPSSILVDHPQVFGQPGGGGMMDMLGLMAPMLGQIGGKKGGGTGAMIASMLPMVLSTVKMLKQPMIMNMSEATKDGITKGVKDAVPEVDTTTQTMADSMEGIFGDTVKNIGGMFQDMFKNVSKWLSDLFSSSDQTQTGGDQGSGFNIGGLLKSGVSMISKLFGSGPVDSSAAATDILNRGDYTISQPQAGGIFENFPSPFGNQPGFSGMGNAPTPPQFKPGGVYLSGGNAVSGADLNKQASNLDFSSALDGLDTQMNEIMSNSTNIFSDGLTSVIPDFGTSMEGTLGSLFGENGSLSGMLSGLFGENGSLSGMLSGLFGDGGSLSGMLSGLFGGSGGGGGGLMSMFGGGGGGGLAGLFGGGAEAGASSAAMDIMPLMFAAKGGMVPNIGMAGVATQPISTMVHHYAKGGMAPGMGMSGIAKNNTMVNVGENAPSQFEAVVPLPDNRTLPVTITDKSMPYKAPATSGPSPTMVAAAMPEMPQPIVHVQMLGDMVNPASKGMTPEQSVQVWIENVKRDGPARQAVKEIVGR